MAKVIVRPGACGFTTAIEACSEDMQYVTFDAETGCPTVSLVTEMLGTVDAYHEVGAGANGEVLSAAREVGKGCCAGCLVPSGLLKVMCVAVGLALPVNASIEFCEVKGADTTPVLMSEGNE